MADPIKPIQYQSELGNLLDIGKLLAGSKQTQQQSSQSNANIDPLMALLQQQMDPNALTALVQNLFAQGAAQVPTLTAQFANATGSRVNNNTMLAQSLAGMNTNIAAAIAQSLVQQQANASQTAGRVAEATKSPTTTATTKTQMANPVGAGVGMGGALLIGSLLNKMRGTQPKGTAAPAPAGEYTSGFDLPMGNNPMLTAPPMPAATPITFDAPATPISFDQAAAVSDNIGSFDFANFANNFDFAGLTDGIDFATAAAEASAFSDATGLLDGVDGWFADGGVAAAPARNMANFGAAPTVTATDAVSYDRSTLPAATGRSMPAQAAGPIEATGALEASLQQYDQSNFNFNEVAALIRQLGQGSGLKEADFAEAVPVFGNEHRNIYNSGYTEGSNYEAIAARAVSDALSKRGADVTKFNENSKDFVARGGERAMQRWQATQQDDDIFGGIMDFAGPVLSIASMFNPALRPLAMVAGVAQGINSGSPLKIAASVLPTVLNANPRVPTEGKKLSMADGGRVRGAGTGTSDSVPATLDGTRRLQVSSGEYILPTDVTNFIGRDVLDTLTQLLHTPVNGAARV